MSNPANIDAYARRSAAAGSTEPVVTDHDDHRTVMKEDTRTNH
ncbi:hypothetical protein [Nocardia brevicatena]|nr:hypothetical protein [Nocardia brevicatena]